MGLFFKRLVRIAEDKAAEVRRRCAQISDAEIRRRAAAAAPPRDFAAALKNAAKSGQYPVIAEIKRKSPTSEGFFRANFAPAELAAEYESGGAACLSVLTDEPYFGGTDADLQTARAACALPILRKDFMLEEWQIYESRALGADAVLLIAALLPPEKIVRLAKTAENLGMAVLAEAHNKNELDSALSLKNALVGINSRALDSFQVSLDAAATMLPLVKQRGRFAVAESGIKNAADIARMKNVGADAFLIGQTLMRANSPAEKLHELFCEEQQTRAAQTDAAVHIGAA